MVVWLLAFGLTLLLVRHPRSTSTSTVSWLSLSLFHLSPPPNSSLSPQSNPQPSPHLTNISKPLLRSIERHPTATPEIPIR